MSKTTDPNHVVICGGGPVGFFCALRLSQAGIPCILLEREPQVLQTPRAVAYSPPTITVLDEAGILDDCLRIGKAQNLGCFRAPGPNGKVYAVTDWKKTEKYNKYPYSLMIGQHLIAGIILERLAQYSSTQVLFNHEVIHLAQDDRGVTLKVRNILNGTEVELKASYVVGADGGRSFVRRAIGQQLEGFTYENEIFVAANIYFPFENYPEYLTRNFLVDEKQWAVVARTGREGEPWRVAYGEDPNVPEAEIRERAASRIRELLPGPEPFEIVRLQPYRVHQRTADKYRVGRVLLAGDAAHLNNPIGGMGLTTGLTDAAALSDALIARISGKAGDEILDEYSDCRRKVFDEVTNPVSQRMKKLAQATPSEVQDLERTYFKKLAEDDAFASQGLMDSYKLLTRLSCYQDQDHVKAKPI